MNEITPRTTDPGESGQLLLRLLRGRRLEGFEKSFKMAHGTLLANRYLLGIHRNDIVPASLFDVCARIGMPPQYLAAFKENLPDANTIHFGFEDTEPGGIYKVYLEFAQRLRQPLHRPFAGGREDAEAVLLHLAYKWDALDPARRAVARYHCYPGLSVEAMLVKLTNSSWGGRGAISIDVAENVVALAAGRCREGLMYLEASEENNPRASFDVNVHEAGIRLHEIERELLRACEHYSIPADRFTRLYDRAKPGKLGHVSGGTSRAGTDFLSFYYELDPR